MEWIKDGLLSLLGVLVGAWLSHHFTMRLTRLTLSEARRDGQRRLIKDLLDAGRTVATIYEIALPILSRGTSHDWIEFAHTDSGKELRAAGADFTRALTAARIYVGDTTLIEPIQNLSNFSRVHLSFDSNSEPSLDPMKQPINFVRAFTRALDALEDAAAPLLRVPIIEERNKNSLLTKTSLLRPWRKSKTS